MQTSGARSNPHQSLPKAAGAEGQREALQPGGAGGSQAEGGALRGVPARRDVGVDHAVRRPRGRGQAGGAPRSAQTIFISAPFWKANHPGAETASHVNSSHPVHGGGQLR